MKKQELILKWLNKEFGNLTPVVGDDRTFYVDKDRKPLFMYFQGSKNGDVYIHHDRIWVFFESVFGMDYKQTQDIMNMWLEETYNLKGFIPANSKEIGDKGWRRPIN